MIAVRVFLVALVKLATLAAFVWLTQHDRAAWSWPLLFLFVLTRWPSVPEPVGKPATSPAAAGVAAKSAA